MGEDPSDSRSSKRDYHAEVEARVAREAKRRNPNTGDAGGGSGRGGLLAFLILVGMILWILRACAR
jgi:hypothetical protein